jgi:hypothetical protein
MKTSDMVIGVGLIILGILFLFENFGYIAFDFADVWPVFVIMAGAGFWIGFIQDKKNYGLVMPGTILIIYGLMFFYCSVEGWYYMTYLWPVFIIGPGIGFFMMYLLGQREKGMLVPASILTGLGLLFMLSKTGIMRYWPVILIIVGIVLIVRYQMKPKQGDNDIIEK